ncbi:MAG: twin-arginine translocase subunit TatC [Planctomyces sp.]|nr:twin-arginine translocase subunit TatC [Planctomyces sp.]
MAKSRDLFDDTTMSFGEHLEVLRVHVARAMLGVVLAIIVSLFFGDRIFALLRSPIETALAERGIVGVESDVPTKSFWEYVKSWFEDEPVSDASLKKEAAAEELRPDQLRVSVSRSELRKNGLVPATPGAEPGSEDGSPKTESDMVPLVMQAPEFAQLKRVVKDVDRVTTLKVEEGFMAYIKVCTISGVIISSPWVFYQIWLFVAAGLHPHERKYVYVYLPMSLFLFLSGALAGFYFAFPLMLRFLIGFNDWLNISIQPRLSEYISLSLVLPLMFGISFQLPLVMLFLERINLFTIDNYRQNRRVAILVIAILSMILTTDPTPTSMLLMMCPLVVLYEVGIQLCRIQLTGPPPAPIR